MSPSDRPAPDGLPAYDLEAWRRRVPILERYVHLASCSRGPLLRGARRAAEAWLDSWERRGTDWEAWLAEVEAARSAFAALIGASPDEVAVCASVSDATARLASALDFRAGRRKVLASAAEFPTVGHVWLAQERRGARVEWVPFSGAPGGRDGGDGTIALAAYERALDRETALVSACHGYFQNGFLQDVAAIAERAHAAGARLFVDAYQTAGVVPIDVRALDVDFLASGTLKYLLGPEGLAFLYVRRELIDELRPTVTGWLGRADPFAFRPDRLDWAATARRFDTGTPPVGPAYVARAGLEAILEVGPAAVAGWTRELSRRLLAGARERELEVLGPGDPARKTPATAVRVPGDSRGVEAALRERGVLASARGPAVRLAPHFFTTLADVDAGLDALAEIVGAGGRR